MNARRSSPVLILLLLAFLMLGGCTTNMVNDSHGQIPLSQDPPRYQDGVYRSTFDHHDNEGYRPEMFLTVREGIITQLTYREISLDGKNKIDNMEYVETFKETHNLDLSVLYTRLYNSVIRNQGIGNLPTLSDFPDLSNSFRQLCESILLAARDGKTEGIRLPMNEVYLTQGEADEEGYLPTLKVTFVSGNIISVSFTKAHPDGPAKEEREDILQAYSSATGLDLKQVYGAYASQILLANSLEPVDAVAGATQSAVALNELLEQIQTKRRPYEPLP